MGALFLNDSLSSKRVVANNRQVNKSSNMVVYGLAASTVVFLATTLGFGYFYFKNDKVKNIDLLKGLSKTDEDQFAELKSVVNGMAGTDTLSVLTASANTDEGLIEQDGALKLKNNSGTDLTLTAVSDTAFASLAAKLGAEYSAVLVKKIQTVVNVVFVPKA